jgi:hypothetical protein
MHLDAASVTPTTTIDAIGETKISSINNSKVTLDTPASPTSTKQASKAKTTSTPQFNTNNAVKAETKVTATSSVTTKANHMCENWTKHAPNHENLTVKRTSTETIDEAANQQVGGRMHSNAAAAVEQTAGDNKLKFSPTDQPTDTHQSRKYGIKRKKKYGHRTTTNQPSSSSKVVEMSHQTPGQKEEEEQKEKIYVIPKY